MSNQTVLEHRVTTLERETTTALQGINESLKTLTALEAHHAQTKTDVVRAFDELKVQADRLRDVELALPQIKLVTKHVTLAAIAIVGMVGAAAAKVTFGW